MPNPIIISQLKGRGLPLRGNDIDTDRIIPARYMKCVTFAGLGVHAFHDQRFDAQGESKGHPFDDPRWARHPVLVVNANFGCGSSREHAPQALKDYGIRALIGESFAEIFAGNCSALGIPALNLDSPDIKLIQNLLEQEPETELHLDLEAMQIRIKNHSWKAHMPEFYRQALLDGSWDSAALLAQSREAIASVASRLPYIV